MGMERNPKIPWAGTLFRALLLVTVALSPVLAQEDESSLHGEFELLYRSVSTDGSTEKFNEDFDAIDSGIRLGRLFMDWQQTGSNFLDFARLDLNGLGGEPFESSSLSLGRKDVYDLRFVHRKQDYVYNLFNVTDDEDGSSWNTDHRMTDLNLSLYVTERTEVMIGYRENRKTGESLFMKDIERDLFRLKTPVDQDVKRYSAGVRFSLGQTRILFRQSLRQYNNQFENHTEGDEGLATDDTGDLTRLDSYDWVQNDDGTAQLTDIQVISPLGDRVNLSVSYYGTLFGEEEIENTVSLNAVGDDFAGVPFTISGAFNEAEITRETDLIDVDLSVRIANPLIAHLQVRSLDRETESTALEDLDGDAVVNTVNTQFDQSVDVATVLLEYRPMREWTFRGGYRTIDRELDRSGFATPERNEDFKSDGDTTLIFGFVWRPADWLDLSGDYEDGDVERPFTQVSLFETEHTRVRATFKPMPDMRLSLSFTDFENKNDALTYSSRAEGTSYAGSLYQRISPRTSYMVTYTSHDIDTDTAILFDTAGFGGTENGDTSFDTEYTSLSGQLNIAFTPAWEGYFRVMMAEADGNNVFLGDVSGVISPGVIDQELLDWEAGVKYRLPSGLFVGGSLRGFDFDNVNEIQNYDGTIITFRAGFEF